MEFYFWPHRYYFPPPSRIDWTMCDVKQKFNQIIRKREREKDGCKSIFMLQIWIDKIP